VSWFHRSKSNDVELSKSFGNNGVSNKDIRLLVLRRSWSCSTTSVRWEIGEVLWSNTAVKNSLSDEEGEPTQCTTKEKAIKGKRKRDAN
jgi:hypothetical protein